MTITDEYSGARPIVTSVYTTSSKSQADEDIVLLDSGSIHTILRDLKYFEFLRHDSEAWQTCKLSIVAGRQTFKFREGWAHVTLLGGTTLICDHAMFALAANQSLISFRDLRLNGIHILTSIKDGEETLELWQELVCLATARCGASGLYELVLSRLPRGCKTIPPSGGSAYSVIVPSKTSLWYGRMGHPGATMFRRMFPLIT